MKDLILAKWNDILNILENEHGISHIMIHTWIEPLKIYSVEDNKVYFTLDEDYGQRGVEFLKRKLFDIYLETVLRELFQDDSIQVIFTLESQMRKDEKSPTYSEDYNDAIAKSNLRPDTHLRTLLLVRVTSTLTQHVWQLPIHLDRTSSIHFSCMEDQDWARLILCSP
mgnify:CR=1 FL=1